MSITAELRQSFAAMARTPNTLHVDAVGPRTGFCPAVPTSDEFDVLVSLEAEPDDSGSEFFVPENCGLNTTAKRLPELYNYYPVMS